MKYLRYLRYSLMPCICILAMLRPVSVSAHCCEESDTTRHSVTFGVKDAVIDTSANSPELRRLRCELEKLACDSCQIKSVNIRGYASPEGTQQRNDSLALARAESFGRYLAENYNVPEKMIAVTGAGIDWNGLNTGIAAEIPEYADVLDNILRKNPVMLPLAGGMSIDSRVVSLRRLGGGRYWNDIYRKIFPSMRRAEMEIVIARRETSGIQPVDEVSADSALSVPETPVENLPLPDSVKDDVPAVTENGGNRGLRMALKANALYYAALIPNIGVEFYFGDSWGAGLDWMYAWWSKDSAHRYWRVYGGDVSVSWWPRNDDGNFTGHHFGAYLQTLTYDFEFHGKGYMSGRPGHNLWDRMTYGGGLEYGYTLPLRSNLNLDFTVGLGCLTGKVEKYIPADGHYVWLETKKRTWFGPTKAEISIVWLIGGGFHKNGKGGAR